MHLCEIRQEKILSILEESREVYVSRLSEQLQVSEMTIRRDLKLLEQQGKLKRVFGGAVYAPEQHWETVDRRGKHLSNEKCQLAAKAIECVQADSLVFIGGGSTTAAFADQMAAVPSARIVTHSVRVVHHLAPQDRDDVYVLGGTLRPSAQTLIGPEMLEALERYLFDFAVIGVAAIDSRHGFLEPTEWHAFLNRTLRRHSRQVMVVADHTKFGARADLRALTHAEVDILVTDRRPPEDHFKVLTDSGVQVFWP